MIISQIRKSRRRCKVLNVKINSNSVEQIRLLGKGINNLNKGIYKKRIKRKKVKIAEILFQNLNEKYNDTKNEDILKRPVFDLIEKLRFMANTNHPPVNTFMESKNKEIISDLIKQEKN